MALTFLDMERRRGHILLWTPCIRTLEHEAAFGEFIEVGDIHLREFGKPSFAEGANLLT
jgi:hypothetical protein